MTTIPQPPQSLAKRFLIRLSSDLTIKSDQVRAQFLGRLFRNIHNRLSQKDIQGTCRVEKRWSRIYVEAEDPNIAVVLSQIFGVHGVQEILAEVPAVEEGISNAVCQRYTSMIVGKTFAVRVRRTGTHPFTSEGLERSLGAALMEKVRAMDDKTGTKVSLNHPEVVVSVEVRGDLAMLLGPETSGPRGLPIGVGGRALALVSGGFDSMVAAWMAHKRGLELDFVTFNMGGAGTEGLLVANLADFCRRWSTGSRSRLVIVDFSEVVGELRRSVRPSLGQVILKRMFYRAAQEVAHGLDIQTLITGENIGQVSSQTLQNLYATEMVFDEPSKLERSLLGQESKGCRPRPMVLRPLIMAEKDDIIAQSRSIGVYEGAVKVPELCQIFKDRPSTQVASHRAATGEGDFDFGILGRALQQAKTVVLKSLTDDELAMWTSHYNFDLRVSSWRGYDILIDMRSEDLYQKAHLPKAINLAAHRLEFGGVALDQEKSLLLYCEHGLESALIAQSLRQKGLKAFSLNGGFASVKDVF